MNTLYRIADGSAEAMEFTASANTATWGSPEGPPAEEGDPDRRAGPGGDIIIPEGSSSIREGDSVILISRDLRIPGLERHL